MSSTDSSSSKSCEEDELSSSSESSVSPTVDDNQLSEPVLKKFKWALEKVKKNELASKTGDREEAGEDATKQEDVALTESELINLIKSWEPKRDIICLYVRWSRQLRRNFNLDSISTLLCLSRQCGYTPVNFICKVKTLTVFRAQKNSFGVSFLFGVAADRKDVNEESLHKEFLGLSVTLALLQEQVGESPSILGKVGKRHTGPRVPQNINIPLLETNSSRESGRNNETTTTIESHPNVEFHTQQSMLNRIWKSINHRWIAYYLVEHLFREESVSWVPVDGLVYSFQMMSPCGPVRYEFLCPIVGYCLRFQSTELIETHRDKLRQIHKDPRSFHGNGCSYQQQYPIESQAEIIVSCFKQLSSRIKKKRISYTRKVSEDIKWTMIRAYVFHFWLESITNQTLRNLVSAGLNKVTTRIDKATLSVSEIPTEESIDNISIETTTEKPYNRNSSPKNTVGFETIMASRRNREMSTRESDLGTREKDVSSSGRSESWKPSDTKWSSLRLVSPHELKELVRSFFIIHRTDGVVIISELSPFEVYSANNLHKLEHYRCSKKPPYSPIKDLEGHVKLTIDIDTDFYVDKSSKTFHIARENCACFKEYSNVIPSLDRIRSLCHAVVLHGEIDEVRGIGQYRCNIGNGGQNWVNNAPCELHGLQFEKKLKSDSSFNSKDVLMTVGEIMEFTWKVCNSMQIDAKEYMLAPNRLRKQMYACRLNEYLGLASKDVGFEDLTIVVSCLHPTIHEVKRHRDTMNDSLVGYTRAAAFNLVLIDDSHPDSLCLIHFQVLFNFWKIIGQYMTSFHQLVSPITSHCRRYVDKWNRSMYGLYAGKTDKIPSIYDRSNMFLDDSLEYSQIQISDSTRHKDSISDEYILTEIGISRTMSMSMFIDPLFQLQKYLKTDQLVELVFTCSFMSNPFWFNWTMCNLLEKLKAQDDTFNRFQLHPFYDWHDRTLETFGTWQGGPYNRWSPCGGSNQTIPELFGAHTGASINERKRGERRLSDIVSLLLDHVSWINRMADSTSDCRTEIDVGTIKLQYETIVKRISNVVPCQFNTFRLCIFNTIIAGCGILKQGVHLHQLMFPIPNSASFKHLSNPVADVMTTTKAYALGCNQPTESICNDGKGSVPPGQHDMFMRYLSIELGFKVYCRDEIECILGESHPMRTLNCKDWFRKGMALFDCNNNGEYFTREYGKSSEWTKIPPPSPYVFAFRRYTSVYYDYYNEKLLWGAIELGKELRDDGIKLSYKGRTSKTSCKHKTFTNNFNHGVKYSHASIQIAYFYVGLPGTSIGFGSMYVLGDGDKAVPITSCNNIIDCAHGTQVVDTLKNTLVDNGISDECITAGSYHRDPASDDDEVTYLPGHLDKAFVKNASFVPIGMATFFILVAIPHSLDIQQDATSMEEFNGWKNKLSEDAQQNLQSFLKGFDTEAKTYMRKKESLTTYIYALSAGSILSFPANAYYHATILPKRAKGIHRDLLIFHPLDGCS